eukprot:scaffold312690_cov23-Tisochrysis_lutea.AAC.1
MHAYTSSSHVHRVEHISRTCIMARTLAGGGLQREADFSGRRTSAGDTTMHMNLHALAQT